MKTKNAAFGQNGRASPQFALPSGRLGHFSTCSGGNGRTFPAFGELQVRFGGWLRRSMSRGELPASQSGRSQASRHGLAVVTRDPGDFVAAGVTAIDPWIPKMP
jgi:hypothetical protein